MSHSVRFVISLLAPDEVGLLQRLSSTLTELGGNIDGLSQTVIHGYCTLIMTVTFTQPVDDQRVDQAIAQAFDATRANWMVRPFESPRPQPEGAERYVLTLSGVDQPGILKMITSFLSGQGINIEDYYFSIQGPQVWHIAELTIPAEIDVHALQAEIQQMMKTLGLKASLQHENLFRVTNDVFSVRECLESQP